MSTDAHPGEVWFVDFGLAAKVRPVVVLWVLPSHKCASVGGSCALDRSISGGAAEVTVAVGVGFALGSQQSAVGPRLAFVLAAVGV